MFYEETQISSIILKCQLCNSNYNEQTNQPILLTCCGNTICSSCATSDCCCRLCSNKKTNLNLFINQEILSLTNESPGQINNLNYYKEIIILNCLKCNECKQWYDEYDSPKFVFELSQTICNKCCIKFKCDSFVSNELLFKLRQLQPIEIKRYDEFKTNINTLKLCLNDLMFTLDNADYFIKEYFLDIRLQIQLYNEIKMFQDDLKSKEDLKNENLIDSLEDECMKSCEVKLKNNSNIKNRFKKILDETNIIINDMENLLKEYGVDEQEIMKSNELCSIIKLDLDQELKNFKGFLFNYELVKFNSIENVIEYEPYNVVSLKFY